MAKTRCTASRDTVAFSSFFKCRLLGRAGGLAMMRPARLQLGLAPPEQLGNGIDAVGDVPGVAQIDLRLMQPADVAGPHLRLQAVPRFRRDAFRHAAPLRRRQQPRQAAFAIALPPALNGAHTIVQDLRGLTDARPSLRNRSIRTDRFWSCPEPPSPRLVTAQYLPRSTVGK